MRTVKNRIFISVISLISVFALCLSLGSCTIRLGSYSLGGDSGQSLEDWLNGDSSAQNDSTTSSSAAGKPASVFTDIPDQNSGGGTTIKVEGSGDNSVEYAVAKGLTSSVSVVAAFKSSSGTWGSTSSGAAAGSGVILKLDKELGNALIMTNYHIVYNESSRTGDISDDIKVYLYGSESYLTSNDDPMAIPATYVGGSMKYDLALLYVEGNELLKKSVATAVTIADSDQVRVGQTVLAIGNPGAEGLAVTKGIISKESESIVLDAVDNTSAIAMRVIRIDAPINSGNSGGGVFDTSGNLVGIVNAKSVETNVDNIGYAIPSNVIRAIADNIIYYCVGNTNKQVKRVLLGVTVTAASSYAKLDPETGLIDICENVMIESVNSDAAAKGILKEGDILRTITLRDKTIEINRTYHVVDFMLDARVGDTVTLTIERDGETKTVSITLTEKSLTTVE